MRGLSGRTLTALVPAALVKAASPFSRSLLLNWKGGVCFALRSAPPRILVPVSILQHGPSKFTNSISQFPLKTLVSSFLQQAVGSRGFKVADQLKLRSVYNRGNIDDLLHNF